MTYSHPHDAQRDVITHHSLAEPEAYDLEDPLFGGKSSEDFYDATQISHGRATRLLFSRRPIKTTFYHFFAFLWLLPRNIGVGVMLLYRRFISPLYGNVCKYYPTCSDYTMQAIRNRGFITGVIVGSWRILRCNPFSSGGIDKPNALPKQRYALTSRGFVYLNPSTILNGSDEAEFLEKGI